jgi:hypothetical protein
MLWIRVSILAALAVQLAVSAPAEGGASDPERGAGSQQVPTVLRPTEPADSGRVVLPAGRATASRENGRVLLPGPGSSSSPAKGSAKSVAPPAPSRPATFPSRPVEQAVARPAPAPPVVHVSAKPALTPAPKAAAPASKPSAASPKAGATPKWNPSREVADVCQKQIKMWKEADARRVLGPPTRQRPAYDETHTVNGTIYAFADPSNKYKELELDFDQKTGRLRTVFVYPPQLTWQDCKKRWNGQVAEADAAQGRKFYSYTNRRLDVLVDPSGKVISLGWY